MNSWLGQCKSGIFDLGKLFYTVLSLEVFAIVQLSYSSLTTFNKGFFSRSENWLPRRLICNMTLEIKIINKIWIVIVTKQNQTFTQTGFRKFFHVHQCLTNYKMFLVLIFIIFDRTIIVPIFTALTFLFLFYV